MPFRRFTEDVLESINGVLSPYVGKLMARTAASAHCRDLGIHSGEMSRQQVDALLSKLGLGLIVFLGKEKAQTVVETMRQAIDGLREVQ